MTAVAAPTKVQDAKILLDPMRDPAWRSTRALSMVEYGPRPKPPTKRDDEAVRKYRRFLIEWRKGGQTRRDRLFCEDPGLYFAYQFQHHPDVEWKALLESRILAREPDEYIAAEFATCVEMVKWYHDLFFDVRDRLHSRMYITKLILGPAARRVESFDGELSESMRHVCYRNFAYFGGPLILDVIVTGFSSAGTFPTKTNQVEDWLDDAFKVTLKQRANITVQSFAVNKFNCMQLMEMHVALLAQAQAALSAGGGGKMNEFHQNIELFLDHAPVAIGVKSREGRTEEILKFERTRAEPRADEMLQLAEGIVPDPLKGQLEFAAPPAEEKDGIDESTNG